MDSPEAAVRERPNGPKTDQENQFLHGRPLWQEGKRLFVAPAVRGGCLSLLWLFRTVRVRMTRCSTGALCGGEAGSTGRAAGIDMATAWMPELRQRRSGCPMPMPFRQHMDVLSKSPAPAHGLAAHGEGMDARVEATQERLPDGRQAPSGVSFSLGYFSFGQAKEKQLGRRRRTKALALTAGQARASPASGLLQRYPLEGEVRCLPSQA